MKIELKARMTTMDASRLSKSPLVFFPRWLCHLKGLFIPVWREIPRSKILPVISQQLTNKTVSHIIFMPLLTEHNYVNHFFAV